MLPSGASNSVRQLETRAAMDRTFAKGAMVAASNGMAIEANHQSLRQIY